MVPGKSLENCKGTMYVYIKYYSSLFFTYLQSRMMSKKRFTNLTNLGFFEFDFGGSTRGDVQWREIEYWYNGMSN